MLMLYEGKTLENVLEADEPQRRVRRGAAASKLRVTLCLSHGGELRVCRVMTWRRVTVHCYTVDSFQRLVAVSRRSFLQRCRVVVIFTVNSVCMRPSAV